jgi:hypothetical protein
MIMRAIVVVPGPYIPQDVSDISLICNRLRRQCSFHRSNESFHSAVLPGACGFGTWMLWSTFDHEPREQAFTICAYDHF